MVVIVRDPAGKPEDTYLFTTDVGASVAWVIETFMRGVGVRKSCSGK